MNQIIINEGDLLPGFQITVEPWIKVFNADQAVKTGVNLSEAAEYLGVTERHLKDLCRAKEITFEKPHYREWRFRLKDLEEYRNRKRKLAKMRDRRFK